MFIDVGKWVMVNFSLGSLAIIRARRIVGVSVDVNYIAVLEGKWL